MQPSFQVVGGTAEYTSTSFLRAYWAYLFGPPRHPNLVAITASVDVGIRCQITMNRLK